MITGAAMGGLATGGVVGRAGDVTDQQIIGEINITT
jgi:hypothetical protein